MFWSKLFKKKNKLSNADIVVNSSYTKMPLLEELTAEEQGYVNKLKEEYLNFYDTEDNYIDLDKELFNEIKMCQDLALDIMHNDHFGHIASSIIDSKKLVYYSHEITEINNILKYKYTALNELRKDKKYLAKYMSLYILGRRKINILQALDHQMNLINNLIVIADQRIYDYSTKAVANYPKNINEDIDYELEKRYDIVLKDYLSLFNDSNILNKKINNTDKITYMEIMLNKFVYENKNLIGKLKERLNAIANTEIEEIEDQNDIIRDLRNIKMYFNIFDKYGRSIIKKEDLEEIYQAIFNTINYYPFTYGIRSYCRNEANKEELMFYSKIIKRKAELFINKKSKIFETGIINDNIYQILLKLFELDSTGIIYNEMFIKNNFEVFDMKYIDLLLCLDNLNGFYLYFNQTNFELFDYIMSALPVDHDTIKRNLFKYIIGLCDKTKFEDIDIDREYFVNKYCFNLPNIYEMKLYYQLYKENINFSDLPFLNETCDMDRFINYINKSCHDKTVFLPDGTKELEIYVDKSYNGIKIYLNNDISDVKFYGNDIDYKKLKHIKIYLPLDFNKININFIVENELNYNANFPKARILNKQALLSIIEKIGSTFVLPKKIFSASNSLEDNQKLYNDLYSLFYGFYKSIKCITEKSNSIKESDSSELFNTLFRNIIIFEENSNEYKINNDLFDKTPSNEEAYSNCNDKVLKSYEEELKDFVIKLIKYKNYRNLKIEQEISSLKRKTK
mgnify:FL=1